MTHANMGTTGVTGWSENDVVRVRCLSSRRYGVWSAMTTGRLNVRLPEPLAEKVAGSLRVVGISTSRSEQKTTST